jgi:hypothetical protein
MTSKEEAIALVTKFENIQYLKHYEGMDTELARQCAIIEINGRMDEIRLVMQYFNCFELGNRYKFLIEIKEELKNL